MANLVFKKSSSKHEIMMIKCKKHPKHKQSPGVCSLCLSEKLSRLSSTSSSSSSSKSAAAMGTYCSSSSSSSSLSSYYSSSASSCSSPMYQGKHSLSTFLFGGGKNKLLTKSRSLAFGNRETKKKQNWIFSKLLKPRSKKIDEGLVHSTNMRQIIVTT